MPSLGADMTEGAIVEWLRKPGERVQRGDIIAVVATEKADIDVEVYESGIVDQILVEPGNKVPVGTVLATISSDGAPAAAPETTAAKAPVAEAPARPEVKARRERPEKQGKEEPPVAAAKEERLRASPLARKLAAELNIDLHQVQGSGEHGVIQRADVERTAAEIGNKEEAAKKEGLKRPPLAAPAPPPLARRPAADLQAGMRRAIAAAMARSNREIPHYYLQTSINMGPALQWLEAENQKRSIETRLLPAVLLIKAVALALNDVPELNGFWKDDRHQPQEAVHIGFAIALRQGGLIAPAIHDADLKSLDELMQALRDLITRTRSGRLRGSEVTEATITVTSLGDLGVETVYGVIYPPQVALVGFGRITEQPWAQSGMLGIRPVLTATLAADHRATDGHRGGQFLEALRRYLQEPATL